MNSANIEGALQLLWRASWQASAIAGMVLLLQWTMGARLSARGRYALWAIVVARLLVPVVPESRFSLFNLASRADAPAAVAHHVDSNAAQPPALLRDPSPTPISIKLQAPVAAAEPMSSHRISISMWLAILWGCGALGLLGQTMLSCWKLDRSARRLQRVSDPNVLSIVKAAAATLRLNRHPIIAVGQHVQTPAVIGLFRPILLLPSRVLGHCGKEEIRLTVLHELAHLKRHDVAANWVVTLATILHWFNPIVWLVGARVRADRELACDELVLSCSCGRDADAYGQLLLKLIEILSPPPRLPRRQWVGILETWRPMQRRVRMIAQFNLGRSSSRWGWSLALLLVLILGCTALTDAVHADNGAAPRDLQTATTRPSLVTARANPAAAVADNQKGLEAALERTIPELRFENVGFSDVVEFLRSASDNPNMVIEWRALEAAGIDRNAPVSLNVRNVTLEEALSHVLRDVGGSAVRLDFMIDGGAIVISTEESLSRNCRTAFYDVSDLLMDSKGNALDEEARSRKAGELVAIIEDSVEADTWKSHGGAVGSIKEFNSKLIIVTTPKVHRQIEQLLAKLRENSPLTSAAKTAGTATH